MHNEGKFMIAKRFSRTLKNKIYKYMTPVPKNVHINKLHDIGINPTIHIIEQSK